MIKIALLLVRKKGMSREEFQEYWLKVHGPLVMGIPENKRHVLKYVQSHTLSDWFPFLAGDGPLYDGAAEIWCDSVSEGLDMFAEPKCEELIRPDELKFLDPEKTVALFMNEHTIYQRPNAPIHGGVKLFEVPVRRQGMTRVQCHEYWKNVHAPKVLGCPRMMQPLRRYVQSHSLEEPIPGLKPMRYDGLAELWFDNKEDLLKSFGSQYMERVNPDEPNFVNLEESTAFIAREFIIYERGASQA
jgi:uncharacterized protein (TIGR02118 family)